MFYSSEDVCYCGTFFFATLEYINIAYLWIIKPEVNFNVRACMHDMTSLDLLEGRPGRGQATAHGRRVDHRLRGGAGGDFRKTAVRDRGRVDSLVLKLGYLGK